MVIRLFMGIIFSIRDSPSISFVVVFWFPTVIFFVDYRDLEFGRLKARSMWGGHQPADELLHMLIVAPFPVDLSTLHAVPEVIVLFPGMG